MASFLRWMGCCTWTFGILIVIGLITLLIRQYIIRECKSIVFCTVMLLIMTIIMSTAIGILFYQVAKLVPLIP